MTCPRCSADTTDAARECPSCGVVFAKWRPPREAQAGGLPVAPTRAAALPPPVWSLKDPPKPPEPETLGVTHAGWKAAAIGLALAIALTFFPFLSFILHPINTMVHELGHTTMFWLFGYSAIPAFDFSEGGGVTMGDHERSSLIVAAWVAGLLILAWWQRERKEVLIALAALAVVYFVMFNTYRERLAIALGGHGGEIAFGALFLYRALTGWGCKIEVERPLYAFLAFVILFSTLRLGFTLLDNSIDKVWYLQGKSYADNDLVTAGIYLNWRVEAVARAMIWIALLSIPAAFFAASMRKTIGALSEVEEAALDG